MTTTSACISNGWLFSCIPPDGNTDVSVISDLDSETKYYDNQCYYNSDTECKNDNNQYNYNAEYDDHNCCRFQINIMAVGRTTNGTDSRSYIS